MEINEEDALIEVISGGMDESDQFSYSDQEDAVRPDYVNGKAEDIEIEYESWRMFEGMWKEILSSTCFEHEVMEKCLQFCYLFPRNYEFHKDDIVQLWMAQGFFPVPSAEEELMENTVRLYFEEFERGHIFRLSGGFDSSTGQLRYRLNHSIVDLLQEQHYDDYLRLGDPNSQISENIVHSSVPDSSIDSVNFKKMYQAKQLSTLLIFHEPGYRLDQVPRELFLKLPLLRILDLSHTSITELPSSIGKLKDLRYLNLSETPITALPDSLCTLYQLQTLKLRNCLELVGLPDDMRKLKNLRHLDMDPACLLVSMPPGFGDLTQLQSLPAFVVGKENGCHITELRHMVNIGGTLRILRLENVSISEEAKEAALDVKVYLQNLELQWTELQDGLMVLENLKPHTELGELQIIGYGGAKFPSWIGDPFFSRLVTISIHDCRNCELLPPLGRLPLLCDLCISEMHEVKVIDHQFCGRDMDANFLGIRTPELGMVANNLSNANMFNAFPRLEKLTLNGLPKLEKWIRMEDGDFPHLRKLNISGCSKLTTLPKSSLFKSLHQLVISFCPSLESFPQGGLLTSLQYLAIIDCPLLKEQCQNDQEEDCRMLAHVPNVWIDYQQFSPVVASNQTQNMGINSASTPALVQLLEDFGHQAGSSKQITIKNSAIVLPSDPQLEELIHVKDTELQPHLEGKKRLEDPSTETEQLSEGGYNWRSNLKWSNISKVVSRFVPKWKKQSRNNTQPTDVETSSDEDTEYGGATTGSPVKQIVELRLEQLYDSLANQSYKLSSFHAKFGKMMKKLDVMRSFLKQNSTDEEDPLVKMISAQIREFVYEADDIVLDCGIRADYEELFPLRHYIPLGKGFRLRIERMLRDLTKRAEAIEMETNHMPKNLTSLTGNKGTVSRIASRVSHGRSHSKANGLVKNILTGDVQKIKRWIFTNEKSRQIAIIGMGGTIARTIYKDNDVRCYFDKLIWVRVSREYSVTDILRSFLIQLGMGNSVKSHDDDVDVMSHIKKSLYNKKYLIVMDDVWNMDYDWWRMLLEHLPAECNRSIIITTTNEEIARKMGVTYFHTVQNLDENESWSLFSEVVFSANKKGSVDSVFQTVGKDIVKKCQGISLAIKAVAGLLATKTESSSQWEEVNNNFRDKLNDESIVHTTLQLSYDDLPAMLKHCILCFSIYPQGTVIDAEQLIYWWVGEGLVHGDHRKTAIEVAFQCL